MQEYTVRVRDYKTEWLQNGEYHRLDGPAIEWFHGSKFWYIDGKRLSEEEFNARISVKELTV